MRAFLAFAALGLAALLLFGCLSGIKDRQQSQLPEQPIQPAQPSQPSAPSGDGIGDADISSSEGEGDIEMPGEDLLPPPPDDAGGSEGGSASNLDLSDIDIDISEGDMMIYEEDFVEPP